MAAKRKADVTWENNLLRGRGRYTSEAVHYPKLGSLGRHEPSNPTGRAALKNFWQQHMLAA